jgi:hypothetical protein
MEWRRPWNIFTIKTPNPNYSLYWYLIEFIDWRYSQSCWYFRPALWTFVPLTLSLVSSFPPPPLPDVNKYTVYTYCIQFVRGGVCSHRRKGRGGLRQIKHLPQSPFTGQIFWTTTFGIAFFQSNLSTPQTYTHCNAAEGYYSLIVPCMEMAPRTSFIQIHINY